MVLGRPWLATTDAFIGCKSGDMFLSRGNLVKQVSLYPLAKSITEVHDSLRLKKGLVMGRSLSHSLPSIK